MRALVASNNDNDRLKSELLDARRRLRRAVHRAGEMQNRLSDVQLAASDILKQVDARSGPAERNISVYAGYSFALRRNRIGNSSRAAAINMMGSDDVFGSVKSERVIARYEHYASAGYRCGVSSTIADIEASGNELVERSGEALQATGSERRDGPPPPGASCIPVSLTGLCFKGRHHQKGASF